MGRHCSLTPHPIKAGLNWFPWCNEPLLIIPKHLASQELLEAALQRCSRQGIPAGNGPHFLQQPCTPASRSMFNLPGWAGVGQVFAHWGEGEGETFEAHTAMTQTASWMEMCYHWILLGLSSNQHLLLTCIQAIHCSSCLIWVNLNKGRI